MSDPSDAAIGLINGGHPPPPADSYAPTPVIIESGGAPPAQSWPVLPEDSREYTATGAKIDFATAFGLPASTNAYQIVIAAPTENSDDVIVGTQSGPEVPIPIVAGTSYVVPIAPGSKISLGNYGLYAATVSGDKVRVSFQTDP